MSQNSSHLTPNQIVAALDEYIIGQKDAKRNVAIALRNRWRRMQVKSAIKADITPNNILMIGATGVGKTEIARRLAKIANAPFVKVEASKFTEVGYVGRDVESMVRDLVEQAINMVKSTYEVTVREKAIQQVEEIILSSVLPSYPTDTAAPTAEEATLREQTREKFRSKIRAGELDERKIEIATHPTGNTPLGVGIVGSGTLDEGSMHNLQDMMSALLPKKTKNRKVTIKEAKELLLQEEINKLIDMEAIKEEALEKATYNGIIFIDEIDKIATPAAKTGGPDVSREGVQRDLLPIVEGSNVSTKYGIVPTDHILFIAAGAFHMAKPADLIPELQGRFPIRVELLPLTQEDFCRILQEPNNALIKQYIALLDAEEVTLTFEAEAITEIAYRAFKINQEIENIGARRLHTVMSHLLNEFLFDIPDKITPHQAITITKALVEERMEGLLIRKDLNQYIL